MPDDATPHLGLPYIAAAQAQKHVTHNEALHVLDSIVQLAVLDRDLATPPASPAEGDRYLIAASAAGAWAGQDGKVGVYLDGAWTFMAPRAGWVCFVLDEAALIYFDGAAWTSPPPGAITALQNLALLGIGATADATNPFSAKLNKALWTAKYASEGGDGDLRYTLNKETAADVLSLLFQTGYSGRAEVGLIGDDNLSFKVSPDGSAWTVALAVDKTSGLMTLAGDPTSALHAATKQYVDAIVAAQDAMVFKGVIDCSANPNYPAADRGHTYRVSVAGKIGGAAGVNVEAGDLAICLTDGASAGNQATVGSAWTIAQSNLDGAVIGPSSATDGDFALFNGATGKLIKDATPAQATAALSAFVGDSGSGGTKGLVPAPASGDAAAGKFLKASGAWAPPAAGDISGLGSIATFAEMTAAQFRANTPGKAVSTDKAWSAADLVALTDAATIAVDMSAFLNASVTLGGNRTLGNPSNTKNGQTGVIVINQDGTGSRTLAYSSNWKFAGGTAPVLTTAANARDLLLYFVISSTVIYATLIKDVK